MTLRRYETLVVRRGIVRRVWQTITLTAAGTLIASGLVQLLIDKLTRSRDHDAFRAERTADAFGALARGIQEAWGWRADALADVDGAADKLRDALVDYGAAHAAMLAFGSPEVVRILIEWQREHEFDAESNPGAVGRSMADLARRIRRDAGGASVLQSLDRDLPEYLIPTGRWLHRG